MQGEIEEVITTDFERATVYAQQFEEYRVIHVFGEYWDFEAYADRLAGLDTFKETVLAFKGDMAQLNKWYRELERMRLAGIVRR